jgi:hypothetical protein
MALQIIGAGLGRTGTLSLKLALEQLGFLKCYHMVEVLMNPAHAPLWVEAADGRPEWDRIFDGYAASVDYPGGRYWRELSEFYPEAKVILTVRDAERWFESTQATIFSPQNRERVGFPELGEFFEKTVFSHFGVGINDREFMLEAFERHNDDVRNTISPDRLLVLDVKQGWEPLCEFLDVPVPDTPFPRTNSREEMAAMNAAASEARRAQTPPTIDQVGEMLRQRLDRYRAS